MISIISRLIYIIFGLDLLPNFVTAVLCLSESLLFVYWIVWRICTREYPKMHYRAFRRIECIAPNNWTPDDGFEIGVVIYSGHDKWERIVMKTFPEALICWIWYAKAYWRRERQEDKNRVMRSCVECWKQDVAEYQKQAEAQVAKAAGENAKIVDAILGKSKPDKKSKQSFASSLTACRLIEEIRSDGSVLVYHSGDTDGDSVIYHRNRYWSEDDTWDE